MTAVSKLSATVILPTTGDRGPILECSIPAVLNQSVRDFELFVIGDGVDRQTRQTIERFVDQDDRVRFFDHPKHERRGESYRHEALKLARGRIVCYLCDRDLLLSNHIKVHLRQCDQSDLSISQPIGINESGKPYFTRRYFVGPRPKQLSLFHLAQIPLSAVAHTLSAYRRLPHGWRKTPVNISTDSYMWLQFFEQPWLTVTSSGVATLLYFKRGNHPGLSSIERAAQLRPWITQLDDQSTISQLILQATEKEIVDHTQYSTKIRSIPLLVLGRTPREAVHGLLSRLRRRFRP